MIRIALVLMVIQLTSMTPLAVVAYQGAEESEGKKAFDFDIALEATLKPLPIVNCERAELNLGSLVSGQKGRITLVIHNPLDREIEFAKVRTFCGCSLPKLSAMSIPAKGDVTFSSNVTVPESSLKTDSVFSFDLIDHEQKPVVQIVLKFTIASLLAVTSKSVLLELLDSEPTKQIFVPLVLTEPVKLENLEITTDDVLRDVLCKTVLVDNVPCVRIVASRNSVLDGPVYGAVNISDPINNRTTTLQMSVRAKPPVSIAPTVLWFREDAERPGLFKATALISTDLKQKAKDEKVIINSEDLPEAPISRVFVSSDSLRGIKSEFKMIRSNLVRVTLSVEIEQDRIEELRVAKDSTSKLNWSIQVSDQGTYDQSSIFDFQK